MLGRSGCQTPPSHAGLRTFAVEMRASGDNERKPAHMGDRSSPSREIRVLGQTLMGAGISGDHPLLEVSLPLPPAERSTGHREVLEKQRPSSSLPGPRSPHLQ